LSIELMRDAQREDGWWLLVEGSEQSFVDTSDPLHLEFEYVQIMAQVLDTLFDTNDPVTALHLGGGLCTVPRWLAARHPGSRQRVIEHSTEIAKLSGSLGAVPHTMVVIDDALAVVARARRTTADLVVCDIYDGPDTVTEMFTLDATRGVRGLLRSDGVYLCNLSDATPFALSQVVAATLRDVFGSVVLLAEPPVLRGRRSGNLVLVATDREVPLAELQRRAAGAPVRFRVVADGDLAAFIGGAIAATVEAEIPLSGESTGRRLPLREAAPKRES
jgi:spermidine synthase